MVSFESAVIVEYTDCISAEGKDPTPHECPDYDTKPSDGEDQVIKLLGNVEFPFSGITPRFILIQSGSAR